MLANYRSLISAVTKHGVIRAPEGQEIALASFGATSKVYIDFGQVMTVPGGAEAVVDAVLIKLIDCPTFNRIGGPSSGADPIIGALMDRMASSIDLTQRQCRGFLIRKEPKGRGPYPDQMYEGYLDPGDKVVVIEDVTTSGSSVLKAIKVIEDRGAEVVKVITILDRLAGAKQALSKYDFSAIITLDDLKL